MPPRQYIVIGVEPPSRRAQNIYNNVATFLHGVCDCHTDASVHRTNALRNLRRHHREDPSSLDETIHGAIVMAMRSWDQENAGELQAMINIISELATLREDVLG